MARCEVCGNEYEKAFEVIAEGQSHFFDSFECAIHALAPTCAHCHCHVIGMASKPRGRFIAVGTVRKRVASLAHIFMFKVMKRNFAVRATECSRALAHCLQVKLAV